MAIEIIPKPKTEAPTLLNILFYFSLVLVLVSVSIFFILDYYQNQKSQTLQDLETALAEGKTSQEIVLEKEILGYKKKIDDFSSLIGFHKNISNFFPVLEKFTHPEVQWTQFDLDPEGFQVSLSGKTESFQTLGQQILILKDEDLIKDFSLLSLSIGEEERVEFSFNLLLNPEIFK